MAKTPKKSKNSDERDVELSRELVVEAAIRLIDADGLEKFSLRNLAKALGVFPTAIYWYVPSRELILAAAVREMLQGVVPQFDGVDWKKYVETLLRNFRNAIHEHPNLAPLVVTQIGNTDVDLMLVENNLRAMSAAGFSGTSVIQGHNVIMAAVTGFSVQELAPMPAKARAWQTEIKTRIASISPEEYPTIHALMPELVNRSFVMRWENGVNSPLDAGFELFVKTTITGLEALGSQFAAAQHDDDK